MDRTNRLDRKEVDMARKRCQEAMHLQEIEGNPLSQAQVAMFEMFENNAWSHERRRAHILERARLTAAE